MGPKTPSGPLPPSRLGKKPKFVAFFLKPSLSVGPYTGYNNLACQPVFAGKYIVRFIVKLLRGIGFLGSNYMIVAISLERYLGICHPQLSFSRRSWMFILPVILINCVYYFPTFFEYKVVFENEKYHFKLTGIISYEAYNIWAPIFVRNMFPMIALFVLNGFIIATIRKTTKETKCLKKTQSTHERNTTRILHG